MNESVFKRGSTLNVAIALGVLAVFTIDLLMPLGIVVWLFYLAAFGLSLYSSDPAKPIQVAVASTVAVVAAQVFSPPKVDGIPAWLTLSNRVMGIAMFWTVAPIARQLIVSRKTLLQQNWVRVGQRDLGARVQGELPRETVADNILQFLCEYLRVPVGALYAADGAGGLHQIATYAGVSSATSGRKFVRVGESMLGQAVKSKRLLQFDEVPDSHLPFSSALGQSLPRQLVAMPTEVDGVVMGAIELGFLEPASEIDYTLLESVAEPIAIALRSCAHRERLATLLEQTQQQAEALQVQQEELKVANEELENQSNVLRESQARLETQQAELEEVNAQLEQQTDAVEQHRDDLLRTQAELVARSEELARTSQYKSEFLANMSHELRTPLNSALILSKLLSDNKEGNLMPEQVKAAATIYSAGNDLLALINDILDLSRIEAGRMDFEPEDVDVRGVLGALERTFEPIAREKNLSFEVVCGPNLPSRIRTDDLRLQQILRNLLSNAIKFTSEGVVRLRAFLAGAHRMGFSVEDTGEGIRPEEQSVIFEAFRQADGTTQRRHGGTGLGLTISRRLAHHLGGEISVESTPAEGSTFTLVVPFESFDGASTSTQRQEPVAPPPSHPPREDARLDRSAKSEGSAAPQSWTPAIDDDREHLVAGEAGGKSVLVLEDDLRFAEILRDLAREQGFRCVVTTRASEALALAEQFEPSAVLLDIRVPDGSGMWVLERLKANPKTRHLPIHVVSVEDYAQQALELGAIGYVMKPARREQLVEAFDRIQSKLEQRVRRVLVVDDDARQRESLAALLAADDVEVVGADGADDALRQLEARSFDCVVLDLNLHGKSGFDLLEDMAEGATAAFPPVIVYTGRSLSREEEHRLRRYASSIIIKGARSPERLLDEITLFLHKVESEMAADAQRLLRTARNREAVLDGRNILVAEDDVRNVFALSSVLEPRGAKLHIARNGREALELLEGSGHDGTPAIDLVLMDIMMPEMDGLTAMRRIRENRRWSKLPIIALTAKAMPDDRDKCLRAGANDYVAKPLDVDKLVSLVKVWMPK